MNKRLLIIFNLLISINISYSQESRLDVADRFLTSNFKTFYSVDTELEYCMAPIIEERVVTELKDSTSFNYSYDSLSNYIKIRTSEDSLIRTFSWDRRSRGSWHDMASYTQFKSKSGKINHQRLDSGDESGTGEPANVLIYGIHTINIENNSYYLMLGWGTHGAGKHHSLARVYKINGETLILCDSIFQGLNYLSVRANRGNKIELKYDTELMTISYYRYEFDENTGFYKRDGIKEEWILNDGIFIKNN